MFTSEMKETFMQKINLHGVTACGLEKILEFVYSGEILLSLDNIEDILAAASHLQVTAVLEFCKVSYYLVCFQVKMKLKKLLKYLLVKIKVRYNYFL